MSPLEKGHLLSVITQGWAEWLVLKGGENGFDKVHMSSRLKLEVPKALGLGGWVTVLPTAAQSHSAPCSPSEPDSEPGPLGLPQVLNLYTTSPAEAKTQDQEEDPVFPRCGRQAGGPFTTEILVPVDTGSLCVG